MTAGCARAARNKFAFRVKAFCCLTSPILFRSSLSYPILSYPIRPIRPIQSHPSMLLICLGVLCAPSVLLCSRMLPRRRFCGYRFFCVSSHAQWFSVSGKDELPQIRRGFFADCSAVLKSGCVVIGSQARLRIWCLRAYGFESLHPHYLYGAYPRIPALAALVFITCPNSIARNVHLAAALACR